MYENLKEYFGAGDINEDKKTDDALQGYACRIHINFIPNYIFQTILARLESSTLSYHTVGVSRRQVQHWDIGGIEGPVAAHTSTPLINLFEYIYLKFVPMLEKQNGGCWPVTR